MTLQPKLPIFSPPPCVHFSLAIKCQCMCFSAWNLFYQNLNFRILLVQLSVWVPLNRNILRLQTDEAQVISLQFGDWDSELVHIRSSSRIDFSGVCQADIVVASTLNEYYFLCSEWSNFFGKVAWMQVSMAQTATGTVASAEDLVLLRYCHTVLISTGNLNNGRADEFI